MSEILKPFDRREAISVAIAARLAGVSRQTIRNWSLQCNIGRRVAGGPWKISRPALLMLLDGDRTALREYLEGRRDGTVAEYFRRCGFSPQTHQETKDLPGA